MRLKVASCSCIVARWVQGIRYSALYARGGGIGRRYRALISVGASGENPFKNSLDRELGCHAWCKSMPPCKIQRKRGENMEGYKILSYKKSGGYSSIRHEAKVLAKGFTPELKEDLAKELSIDVSYHPMGYGIWGVLVEPIGMDEYLVEWTTAASCD